jgi:UDPglucose--hexose-1-phosphate uridylyltransferase
VGEKIRFSKHFQKCSFHNPMLGGKLDIQELEIRRDPLSGRQSVFNPDLRNKVVILFPPSDPVLIERLARESEPRCFLCGDRWKKMTPTYPEELVPGGRVEVGESVLFPNLFPLSQVHAVIRVGSKHYVPLQEFSPQPIEEAFRAFSEFVGCLSRDDQTVRFLTLNGNYLAPAGASIIHPHFQVLGSDVPFSHLEELLTLSTHHREKHGTCYWTDLVESEQEIGLRSIARTGGVSWITGFSPQGSNEVLGILTDKRDFLEMEDKDFSDLAEGLSAVLRGYGAMGFSTFNFTLYSGPLGAGEEAFRCFLRVISRQNVYENYRTDDYFLQKLLKNEIILTTPENLASTLRDFFGCEDSPPNVATS